MVTTVESQLKSQATQVHAIEIIFVHTITLTHPPCTSHTTMVQKTLVENLVILHGRCLLR